MAQLLPKPQQVAHVVIVYSCAELHLNANDSVVRPLHNEIHFLTAIMRSEVAHGCFVRLRVYANGLRYQRLEELTEECADPWRSGGGRVGAGSVGIEERRRCATEQRALVHTRRRAASPGSAR